MTGEIIDIQLERAKRDAQRLYRLVRAMDRTVAENPAALGEIRRIARQLRVSVEAKP